MSRHCHPPVLLLLHIRRHLPPSLGRQCRSGRPAQRVRGPHEESANGAGDVSSAAGERQRSSRGGGGGGGGDLAQWRRMRSWRWQSGCAAEDDRSGGGDAKGEKLICFIIDGRRVILVKLPSCSRCKAPSNLLLKPN